MAASAPTRIIRSGPTAAKIAGFLSAREEIVFAYVFGSFVGEKNFSDIDIGIFVRAAFPLSSLSYEFDAEKRIESLVSIPADVRILNGAPPSFVYRVIKDSILVVDHDPTLRADFEGRILKEYFDFAPFRKRYLEEAGRAPLRS